MGTSRETRNAHKSARFVPRLSLKSDMRSLLQLKAWTSCATTVTAECHRSGLFDISLETKEGEYSIFTRPIFSQ